MPKTTTVTREQIENLIRRMNEIENARSTCTVDEIVAGISALLAANSEGWVNGIHIPDRSTKNKLNRALFELVDDYHRAIDHIVIDPPFVSFVWHMRSVKHNFEAHGCSIFEVDEAVLISRLWMYFDPAPFRAMGMQI